MAGDRTTSAIASDKTLLVGIGAQRSGTTWLGEYLAAHPDVYMSPIKELHYFDARLLRETCGVFDTLRLTRFRNLAARYEPAEGTRAQAVGLEKLLARLQIVSDQDYIDFFLSRAGHAPVMSEITPTYSMLDRAGFARIASVHSIVKFAFLLRNPIERTWSQLRRREFKSGVTLSDAELESGLNYEEILARTDYRRTLIELFAAVPPSAVFLEFFERLFDDRAVERLCRFAGIDFRPGRYDAQVNAAPARPMPSSFRQKAYARFAEVYRYVHDLFAGDIPRSWRDDMAAFA